GLAHRAGFGRRVLDVEVGGRRKGSCRCTLEDRTRPPARAVFVEIEPQKIVLDARDGATPRWPRARLAQIRQLFVGLESLTARVVAGDETRLTEDDVFSLDALGNLEFDHVAIDHFERAVHIPPACQHESSL